MKFIDVDFDVLVTYCEDESLRGLVGEIYTVIRRSPSNDYILDTEDGEIEVPIYCCVRIEGLEVELSDDELEEYNKLQ